MTSRSSPPGTRPTAGWTSHRPTAGRPEPAVPPASSRPPPRRSADRSGDRAGQGRADRRRVIAGGARDYYFHRLAHRPDQDRLMAEAAQGGVGPVPDAAGTDPADDA